MPGKKPPQERKVQRGLSLAPDLYERILAESDKYGRRWNETIELVLARAFPAIPNIPNRQEIRLEKHGDSADAKEVSLA